MLVEFLAAGMLYGFDCFCYNLLFDVLGKIMKILTMINKELCGKMTS
jgi:hypothetical protein